MTPSADRPDPRPESLLVLAREVLRIEGEAVLALANRLDDHFVTATRMILACRGRVVVSGIGKSGHIGRKLAATLASTGTPAFFVHPAEASHGDLGMVTADDLVITISNSGENTELVSILPLLRRKGACLVAIVGRMNSTLAAQADVALDAGVDREACPLGLAPTSSTTAALALGDALAIALLKARGFGEEDFASSHPGGRLGRRLLVRVADVMHSADDLPVVREGSSLSAALVEMSEKGLGMTAIATDDGQLKGIFTDGDLRRAIHGGTDLNRATISEVMSPSPRTIAPDRLAAEAVQQMESARVNGLLVVDTAGHLVGALNMHDLFKAGVV